MIQHRLLTVVLAVTLTSVAVSQESEWWRGEKRPLTAADYAEFERLGSVAVSPDGRFAAWSTTTTAGDSSVEVCRLGPGGREGSGQHFEFASRPVFSADSKWLAFRIGVSAKETERLRKAKKPVPSQLGCLDLSTGDQAEVAGVRSSRFSDDGAFLAMERQLDKDHEGGGDLIVRDLARGLDTTFGRVGSFAWADDRPLLAMVTETPDKVGNGVRVYDAHTRVLSTLASAEARFRGLAWRHDAADLAVLQVIEQDDAEDGDRGADDEEGGDGASENGDSGASESGDSDEPAHMVLAWRGLDGEPEDVRAATFDPRIRSDFPAGQRVVSHLGVRWSDLGDAVFFGIQPEPAAVTLDLGPEGSLQADLEEPAGVEVWHPNDVAIIPRQKITLVQDRARSALCSYWLDAERFTPLGDELTEDVQLLRQQRWALGRDNTPYESEKRFGPTLFDVYRVDTSTGDKELLLHKNKFVLSSSPDGRRFAYVADGDVWVCELATGESVNLTGGVGADFINDERKVLTTDHPPYGISAWSEDGDRVYLNSRWDLWQFAIDGTAAERLTDGAEERVRYRRIVLDPDPRRADIVDPQQAMWLSVYGDRTKRSGFARLVPGGAAEAVILRDKSLGRLVKAEDAETYLYTEEAFDDAPDVFVTDAAFAERHQLSNTNAVMDEFQWGRAELVDYENAHGEPLQGALYYPANYQPGKRFPMITYIYEMRSQNLHRFTAPSETSPYNPAVFSARGYFVFQPDIVYRPQNPGLSALECVVPAVKKVLERDDVDPARVGLVGHSWGAYQTAFLVTHSDVFAAGVAGAPLTDMISMSMSIYWNSGQTDTWIFHESQGRMDRPFWQDLDTYVANSPIFGIEDMKTPLLVAFGDEDGAVDWHQGVEFFNAARLAQKPVVMLVYPGENHGLRKKPNQVDYHHRVLDWFDHYLKGDPAPGWVTGGQSWIERQRELKAFKNNKRNK